MKEKLMQELKRIGWSYKSCGCGIYQIVSDHKKGTDWLFDDYSIYLNNTDVFGKDGRKNRHCSMGSVKFIFDKCRLELDENYVAVSTDGAFVMFYRSVK